MSLVLVTGAAGNVGSRVVRRLVGRNIAVRAFVLAGEKHPFAGGRGVEAFEGNLADRARVREAMRGVSRVYLLSAGTDLAELEAAVVEAAAEAKVAHLVKHSVQGAQYEAAQIPRWHRASEKRIEAAGVPYTFLRPASFASNALGWAGMIKSGGTVYGPFGDVALPVIDPEDIAAVAEKVLTDQGDQHHGRAYELTGPAPLKAPEQVAAIARVIDKPLAYVDVPDDAARKSMVDAGMSAAYADAMIDLVKTLRGLGRVEATTTVADLLGRPPRSFEAFVRDHIAAFR